jgi:hypothetical protein
VAEISITSDRLVPSVLVGERGRAHPPDFLAKSNEALALRALQKGGLGLRGRARTRGDLAGLRSAEPARQERLLGRGEFFEPGGGLLGPDRLAQHRPGVAATHWPAVRCPSRCHTFVSATRRAASAPGYRQTLDLRE